MKITLEHHDDSRAVVIPIRIISDRKRAAAQESEHRFLVSLGSDLVLTRALTAA